MELLPGQSASSSLEDEIKALTEQMAEIKYYCEHGKGKHRADTLPDNEVATVVFLDEVTAHIGLLNDLGLAQSIALAVDSDGQAIIAFEEEEARARIDRHMAMTTSVDDPTFESPPMDDQTSICDLALSEDNLCMATQFFCRNDVDQDNSAAGPSMTHTQRQEEGMQKLRTQVQCCVCYDKFQPCKMIRLKCTHIYCADCLKSLFLRAMKDQSVFPPRCCREPIPLPLVQANMSEQEKNEFESAKVEFTTTDRTYCSNMECGRFIPPSRITADLADCAFCSSTTCAICKNNYHQDDCASDPALQATLSLASREGWQRCSSCRALVQLGIGCYHITCKCRAEFCYLCGATWKTCLCQRWNEQRLVERAQEVADREAIQPLPPADRQLRVAQLQEDLRENHECEHPGRFERVFGNGRHRFECETCGDRHRKYILACRRCHVRVCEDCRRNRI